MKIFSSLIIALILAPLTWSSSHSPCHGFDEFAGLLTIPRYLDKVKNSISASAYFGILIYSSLKNSYSKSVSYDLLKKKIIESSLQNEYFKVFMNKHPFNNIISMELIEDYLN